MGGMFVGGAVGSAGASLAWELVGWNAVCPFGVALVIIALGLHVPGRGDPLQVSAKATEAS